MPIPQQPSFLIPRPFASSGNYTEIPDTTGDSGRASFASGFPIETQLPLSSGGIAPNRTDFNGMFNILSALGFWQQSGGKFTYKAKLNYSKPAVVFYNAKLWWCLKANGPDATDGVRTPGTTAGADYWQEYFEALAGMAGFALTREDATPVGTVIMYYATSAPDGYLACNGASFSASTYPKLYELLGAARTPDLRGQFVRGYDTRDSVDPEGASRELGSAQSDAGRNVTGSHLYGQDGEGATIVSPSGAFTYGDKTSDSANRLSWGFDSTGGSVTWHPLQIDASRVWGAAHTATEFRPTNTCLLYCIKHD